jgi:hypothetical protein
MAVLSRVLTGVLGAAAAAMMVLPGVASADPPPDPVPQPPTPNVNGLAPVKPSDYSALDGNWYAFLSPEGLVCVIQKSGGYGCNGALPAAPEGANLVGGQIGAPASFSMANGPIFEAAGAVKPLPSGSRISFQTLSCGVQGTNTTCIDQKSQSGFVISPAGTSLVNTTPPLLDRPEGTSPYFN